MNQVNELIKIASAVIILNEARAAKELEKTAAGGLTGILQRMGLMRPPAPPVSHAGGNILKTLLGAGVLGGGGYLAYQNRDKIGDTLGALIEKIKGLLGDSEKATGDAVSVAKGKGNASFAGKPKGSESRPGNTGTGRGNAFAKYLRGVSGSSGEPQDANAIAEMYYRYLMSGGNRDAGLGGGGISELIRHMLDMQSRTGGLDQGKLPSSATGILGGP